MKVKKKWTHAKMIFDLNRNNLQSFFCTEQISSSELPFFVSSPWSDKTSNENNHEHHPKRPESDSELGFQRHRSTLTVHAVINVQPIRGTSTKIKFIIYLSYCINNIHNQNTCNIWFRQFIEKKIKLFLKTVQNGNF